MAHISSLTDTGFFRTFLLKSGRKDIDQLILRGKNFTIDVHDIVSNIMMDYAKPRERMEITCFGKLNGKDVKQVWSYKVTHDKESNTLHCEMITGTPDKDDDLSFRSLLGIEP